MTPADLVDLVERFFEPGFDVEAAEAELGPADGPADGEHVDLSPKHEGVAAAHLERFRDALVGMSLTFSTPMPDGREAIERRFGPMSDAARLHHDDPWRFERRVQRPLLDGSILVEVAAPARGTSPLVSVTARRFFTAWLEA